MRYFGGVVVNITVARGHFPMGHFQLYRFRVTLSQLQPLVESRWHMSQLVLFKRISPKQIFDLNIITINLQFQLTRYYVLFPIPLYYHRDTESGGIAPSTAHSAS